MLFRLTEDPTETRAVHFPDPGVAGYLDRLLRAREETGIAALESIDADLDQDLINELKALGYLE